MNSGRSTLLISRPEFNLLSSGSAKSQFLQSISVDSLLLGLLLLLLFVSVFVEHASIVGVSIIDPEDSMSPASLNDSVPLAEEYLLGLELTELLKLRLDLLEFLPSLPGHPDFARVHHQLRLCIPEISDLLIYLLNVLLSLALVEQRLLRTIHLLQGGHAVSLLQG